ncbi:MAG: hypothetical protein R3326_00950 [Gemmatimonadota bacterium]|nr:hypothetical protein [Gemmatimonadota bacterium]
MNTKLRRTPWNRIALRLRVPRSTGVYLVGAGTGRGPSDILRVGSASNLRARLLELVEEEDLQELHARAVHWVGDLTIEQARIAERLFTRRYDPPAQPTVRSRYEEILAG